MLRLFDQLMGQGRAQWSLVLLMLGILGFWWLVVRPMQAEQADLQVQLEMKIQELGWMQAARARTERLRATMVKGDQPPVEERLRTLLVDYTHTVHHSGQGLDLHLQNLSYRQGLVLLDRLRVSAIKLESAEITAGQAQGGIDLRLRVSR